MADRRQGLPSDPPTATGTDAFVAPSGEQVEITHGDQRATVVELGGGLRTYTSRGRDLLDGYAIEEMCSGGRGQVLMPWPNRIRDGSYEIDGQRLQLALTEPKAGNAIHGLVRWASWTIKHRTPGSVLMEHRLYPQPGYPFVLELSIEYALRDDGLSVRSTATNIGTTRCPFGSGAHPYLALGKQLDELSIEAPGQTILNADSRGIPLDSSSVEGTAFDPRHRRPIGDMQLDHAFTDLERDERGLAWVGLTAADSEHSVSLWADQSYRYIMLFTGDTLASGRRQGLAVEPMTCAPDAFRSGHGLITLEPGESFSGTWGIAPWWSS